MHPLSYLANIPEYMVNHVSTLPYIQSCQRHRADIQMRPHDETEIIPWILRIQENGPPLEQVIDMIQATGIKVTHLSPPNLLYFTATVSQVMQLRDFPFCIRLMRRFHGFH
jgi:hypothetical protein